MTPSPTCTLLPDVALDAGKIASIGVHSSGTVMLTVYTYPATMSQCLHLTPPEALVLAATLTDAAALAAQRIGERANPEGTDAQLA